MKKYINTSNYYLSTITNSIPSSGIAWSFDVSDVTVDWVQLPEKWYFWVDVDFGDATKREIFRIKERNWYTLTYDDRISPYWMKSHSVWAAVWLRDFSQLLNSLSTNTDNFWEVERITWEPLKLKVRGWYVFTSWNANVTVEIPDEEILFEVSSTAYIVLDFSDELWLQVARFKKVDEINPTWHYPIAKIETNTNMVKSDWITDLRSTMIWWGWEWDMKWQEWTPIFNPDWLEEWQTVKDAFDMDNMKQWQNNLFISPSDKNKYDDYQTNKQDTLVSWSNIVTINHKSIIDVSQWDNWNISLDTVLTVWWDIIPTEDWASTFTFPELRYPINDDAFIVFSDSGTMLIKNWDSPNDYSYDASTHTITFNNPLYDEEHAIVWVMYNNWDWETQIWDWDIFIKYWNQTIWTFHVNQNDTTTIDISPYIHNIHSVTREEYNELLPDAETNWEWYLIVS